MRRLLPKISGWEFESHSQLAKNFTTLATACCSQNFNSLCRDSANFYANLILQGKFFFPYSSEKQVSGWNCFHLKICISVARNATRLSTFKEVENNNEKLPGRRCYKQSFDVGSVCGAVGRAVASDTRDPWLESRHRPNFIYQLYNRKGKNKEKEAGNGKSLKNPNHLTYS